MTSLGRQDVKIDTDSTEGKKTTGGKTSTAGTGKSTGTVKRVPSRTKFGSDKVSRHFHKFTTGVSNQPLTHRMADANRTIEQASHTQTASRSSLICTQLPYSRRAKGKANREGPRTPTGR